MNDSRQKECQNILQCKHVIKNKMITFWSSSKFVLHTVSYVYLFK